MSIYGGVEADPNYVDPELVGPSPNPDAQSTSPYKAKTIFDRARARDMNAEFNAGLLSDQMSSRRRLSEESALNPILAERTGMTTEAQKAAELKALLERRPLDLEILRDNNNEKIRAERILGAITNMISQKLNPTVEAEQSYNTDINPEILKSLRMGQLAEQQKQRGLGLQNKISADLTEATAADTFSTGLATSRFGAKEALSNLENFDRLQQNKLRLSDQAPILQEQQATIDRFKTITPGTTVLDVISGKPRYQEPDAMTKALQMSNGIQPGGNTPAQPPQYSEEDVVIVGGKRYIRAK